MDKLFDKKLNINDFVKDIGAMHKKASESISSKKEFKYQVTAVRETISTLAHYSAQTKSPIYRSELQKYSSIWTNHLHDLMFTQRPLDLD